MRFEFKNNYLSVLSDVFNGEKYFFFKERDKVVILPYSFTQDGLQIIGLIEPITIWGRNNEMTAVQGSIEKGEEPHDCAPRELLEETGFNCPYNEDDWTYIGMHHFSKSCMSERHYYLVDITEAEKTQKTTDGSEFERNTGVIVSSPKTTQLSSDLQLHYLISKLNEKLSGGEHG